MEEPKISIIVPVYNAEKYLRECLESLISQTFRDIEILCINDGSADSSLDILNEYALKDNRIKVFSQENSGTAKARNVGLENVSGEYLMFCYSDDTYEPDMCELMYQKIEGSDYDFVMCDANVIEMSMQHGRSQGSIDYHKLSFKGVNILTPWLKTKINVVLWNKIFKMSVIKKYDIKFPSGFEFDDSSFFYQYLSVSNKFYGLDKELYNYKLLPNSIMGKIFSQKKVDKLFDRIYAMEYTINFLVKHDLLENNLWILKMITKGLYFVLPQFNYKNALKFLKLTNSRNLNFFDIEQLKDYEELVLCKKKKYNKLLKQFGFTIKEKFKLFGIKKYHGKTKFYFCGIPVFKRKISPNRKKYYLFGIQILNHKIDKADLILSELRRLDDKFSMFYLKQRLFTKIDVPQRYIICFDCLYDKNQEAVDAYTLFKYLQKNNIPSKYFILKDSPQAKKIEKEKDVITVYDIYHFIYEYAHLIQCSKALVTSFGLHWDLDILLAQVPYLDYVYIDHGVILLKKWVLDMYKPSHFNKILVPTKLTRDLHLENKIWDSNQMILSGMPRWDNLSKTNAKKPTGLF